MRIQLRRVFVRTRARRRLGCALPISPLFAVHHHHPSVQPASQPGNQSAVGLVDTNRTPTKCKSHRRRYLVWVPLRRPALRYRPIISPFWSFLPLSLNSNAPACSSPFPAFLISSLPRHSSCTAPSASSHSGAGWSGSRLAPTAPPLHSPLFFC
ncbi:hypothetical protein LX36DRAFT_143508 [Colletotrichum falcatum]|nr:hypothetical protein LX36DRAFT_143508 [Colletotrichum falcatum]